MLGCVQGTGQTAAGLNWGDGFITDAGVISGSAGRVSDPRPFFAGDSAASRGYRTALAPHVYGPSVTGVSNVTATFGAPLWERLTRSWGSKTGCSTCSTVNAGTSQFYPGLRPAR